MSVSVTKYTFVLVTQCSCICCPEQKNGFCASLGRLWTANLPHIISGHRRKIGNKIILHQLLIFLIQATYSCSLFSLAHFFITLTMWSVCGFWVFFNIATMSAKDWGRKMGYIETQFLGTLTLKATVKDVTFLMM